MSKDKSRKRKRKSGKRAKAALRQNIRHFGQEVGALGKQMGLKGEEFGKRFEKRGGEFSKRMEEHGDECCGRDYRPFGVVGLIFSIIMGVLGLAIIIWALDFLARRTGSPVLFALHDFFFSNLGIFLLIFIVSALFTYCRRHCGRAYLLISPIATAFGITVFFWVISSIIIIGNSQISVPVFYTVAQYLSAHLFVIFWLFLVLGYFFLFLRLIFEGVAEVCRNIDNRSAAPAMKERSETGATKRLYRSGKDKIIAGVCGGIAEYLNIDPVLIRLIWIALILAGGSGILLYIIAWIVIPRNPNHKWN